MKKIILIVIALLLAGGIVGGSLAIWKTSSGGTTHTPDVGAKIVTDENTIEMAINDEAYAEGLLVEYKTLGIAFSQDDRLKFTFDGTPLNVFVDNASSGIDKSVTDKALDEITVTQSGNFDVYLKRWLSGVWTVYTHWEIDETEMQVVMLTDIQTVEENGTIVGYTASLQNEALPEFSLFAVRVDRPNIYKSGNCVLTLGNPLKTNCDETVKGKIVSYMSSSFSWIDNPILTLCKTDSNELELSLTSTWEDGNLDEMCLQRNYCYGIISSDFSEDMSLYF